MRIKIRVFVPSQIFLAWNDLLVLDLFDFQLEYKI